MRRGFTLAETITVVGIAALLAALSYPVFVTARKYAARSTCMSNLRQIGMALAMYREEAGGADVGTPVEMGLPWSLGPLGLHPMPRCRGQEPFQEPTPYYGVNWPNPLDERPIAREAERLFAQYVNGVGSSAVLIVDANHQASLPKNIVWESWTALGLRLDGAVVVRTKKGYPFYHSRWHR